MTTSKILQILASPFFFLDKYLLVQIREKSNNKDKQNLTTKYHHYQNPGGSAFLQVEESV